MSWVTHFFITLVAIVLGSRLGWPQEPWAQSGAMILSLGDDSYITWSELESRTGIVVKREAGDAPLTDFSLLVLSNVSYASLPEGVRDGLRGYLEQGGAMLITGGKQSYGSGGYADTELADLLPLRPSRDDWLPHPFGPTLILQPGHPILKGIEIPTMAFFNELDLNGGAVEIAQYRKASKAGIVGGGDPGGGQIQGGGRRPMPLIAERRSDAGTILAVALDLALTGEWKDRNRFAQNCAEYLLQQSRIVPPQKRSSLHRGAPFTCCAT
jgi:hypothetical protein